MFDASTRSLMVKETKDNDEHMMNLEERCNREQILEKLNRTVAHATAFFRIVDESLFDGYQTARAVLSHLVFWHREYVAIVQALVNGRQPKLKKGSFDTLNARAVCEFSKTPFPALVCQFEQLQETLDETLRQLPDWEVDFPVKQGGRYWNVADRLCAIEAHICRHLNRLERAARLGEEWVHAYYVEAV